MKEAPGPDATADEPTDIPLPDVVPDPPEVGDEEDDGSLDEELRRSRLYAQAFVRQGSVSAHFSERVVVHGDLVVGTRTDGAAHGAARVAAVPHATAFEPYVRPACHDEARQVLADSNVVLLYGPHGWGKRSMALALLHDLAAAPVSELDPGSSMAELTAYSFAKGGGYLVDTLAPTTAADLTAFTARRLAQAVEEAAARVVVTVDDRVRLPAAPLVVRCSPPHDPVAILHAHLRWGTAPPEHERACALVAELGLEDRVRDCVGRPAVVVAVAAAVLAAARGELSATDVLHVVEARVEDETATWFTENQDTDDRAFLVAACMLDGVKYQAVAEAADRLRDVLLGDEAAAYDPGRTRSRRLAGGPFAVRDGFEDTGFGLTPVETVTMADPRFAQAALRHVFREEDGLRRALVRWAFELGRHPNPAVRATLAAAVGHVLAYDFEGMRAGVVARWAGASDRRRRLAAATAVGVAALRSETTSQALALLAAWARGSHPERQWTAAAAYGGMVGWRFPVLAVRSLRELATGENGVRLRAVVHAAAAELVVATTDDVHADAVVDGLFEWLDDADDVVAGAGAEALVHVLTSASWRTGDGDVWPAVLWLRRDAAELASRFARLMRLLGPDTVMSVLREWVVHAPTDSERGSAVSALVTALAQRGGRDRERVVWYLDKWAHVADPSSVVHTLRAVL